MFTLTLWEGPRLPVLEAPVLFGLVHTHDVGCAGVLAKRQGPWLGLRLPSQGVGAALSSGPTRPCVPFEGQGVLERSAGRSDGLEVWHN